MYVVAPRNGLGQDTGIPGAEYVTTALKAYQIATSEAPTEEKAGAAAFTAAALAMPAAVGVVLGAFMYGISFWDAKQKAKRAKELYEKMVRSITMRTQRFNEIVEPLYTPTPISSLDDLKARLMTPVRSVIAAPPLYVTVQSREAPRDVPRVAALRDMAVRYGALFPQFDALSRALNVASVPRPWVWPPLDLLIDRNLIALNLKGLFESLDEMIAMLISPTAPPSPEPPVSRFAPGGIAISPPPSAMTAIAPRYFSTEMPVSSFDVTTPGTTPVGGGWASSPWLWLVLVAVAFRMMR